MNSNPDSRPVTKAKSFEDLFVYQKARELTNGIYALTREGGFAQDFGLKDQIRRAAVSVMSNIAEGFERGSNQEFMQFLYIAKGSCGEVRAQLAIALDQTYIARADHDRLVNLCRLISGGISNFISKLKESSFRGPKFSRRHDPMLEAIQEQQRVLSQLAEERKRRTKE